MTTLEEIRTEAGDALERDAGCTKGRAAALVEAVARAATEEALGIVAGSTQAFGGALDRRVVTLDRVIQALDAAERLPSEFEVGVIFRITPTQGRNVLRTYHARFSESYRARLQSALADVRMVPERHGDANVFVFDFDDPAVLEYAAEKLRRRGLARSVLVDRARLEIVVDRNERDRHGKAADAALAEP